MDEDRIVHLLSTRFGARSPSLIKGIGDDAAVLHPRGALEYLVITTDMLLEDVDFCRSWLTPTQLGHKALAVNLSDLAAMGAKPRYFTVALGLPRDVGIPWIEGFYRGMCALAKRHGAILIGGDLSRSPAGIQTVITAIGETSDRRPVCRSGGRPGDFLYVTGVLGRAAAGLSLLRHGRIQGRNAAERKALQSHRMPEPRCEVGSWLARSRFVRCMMDLSDGLSVDLPRLCAASGTGAEIWADKLPVFSPARRWRYDPLTLALHGGEDFELLFAISARKAAGFEKAYPADYPPISRIGRLRREHGVAWSAAHAAPLQPLIPAGFDHFRSDPIKPEPRNTGRSIAATKESHRKDAKARTMRSSH
jgi:thiamine-monophosphate kinase